MQSYLPPELARSRWRPTAAQRRQLQRERAHFQTVRRAESWFGRELRAIARHVGRLISVFEPGDTSVLAEMQTLLQRYSDMLEPWARITSSRLLADVSSRDAGAWFKTSRDLGLALRREIETAPIGGVIRQLLDDQVELITSLPVDAGRRVQQYTQEFVAGGRRYDDLVQLIRNSGNVTVARATLIARTETAKAHSAITQARAQHVGADQYIWRTVRDADVRKEHRRLEGTVHRWTDPPIAESGGQRHHPGEFPNCRCFAEPILPEIIL
jgi:SPP1 gp7 family putative phage head morphogenesis protein